jgi:DNA-binding NarL/FixJ family response regulator
MPGVNGVPYVTALRARHPGLLILVLTGRAEPHVALSVLDAGANGYLAKGANIDQLLPAIDALLAGQRYVDTQVSLSEAGAQADGPATEGALTRREQQILALIVGGASATEIAGQLAISPLTARKHRENLMRKLDVHNTAELVTYAVRNGLMAR